MSENDTDTELDEEGGIAGLRKAADEGRKAQQALAEMQRELALTKAGVDTSTPTGKMFAKAYDGELDTEAIKTAATEVGAITPPVEPTPVVVVDPAEVAQTQERAALAAGAQVSTFDPSQVDPRQQGWENYRTERQQGAPNDSAASGYLGPILEAAAKGDDRVLFNRQRWFVEHGGMEE